MGSPATSIEVSVLFMYPTFDIPNAKDGLILMAQGLVSGEQQVNSITQSPQFNIQPLEANVGLRRQASYAIKRAITEMDIYDRPEEIRLDERKLSRDLGVSRTPIREALSLLEQEGFVRSVPRRGIYVVRKNKREIIEMVTVWSALESSAARLVCERATSQELAEIRAIAEFKKEPVAFMDEYSRVNMSFHKAIIAASGCALMLEIIENLFIHMRAIRSATMRQGDRAQRSIVDHMNIVAALEARDGDLAAKRVREHTLGLAVHIEKYGDFLDRFENGDE